MNAIVKVLVTGAVLFLAASVAVAGKPIKPPPTPTVSGMDVFSAGQRIGVALSLDSDIASIITDEGYLFEVDLDGGQIRYQLNDLFFAGSGCTGQAYSNGFGWRTFQGYVFTAPPTSPISAYYNPRGATLEIRNYASRYVDNDCVDVSGTGWYALAFPNDGAVTGVTGSPIAMPIVFGVP